MLTRIYNGPHPEVEVPLEDALEDGSTTIIAVRSEPTEFPDKLAVQLDEQGETWLQEDGVSKAAKAAAAQDATTVTELRQRAKEADIKVPTGAKKADIEALLEEHAQEVAAPANTGDDDTAGATADAHDQGAGQSPAASDTAAGGKE